MKKERQIPKDPHLDAPSVANQDKHINFLEEEEKADQPDIRVDLQHEEDEKRKRQWKEGIEAGKLEKDKNNRS
ncbi:MAG: hypothetical protein ACTHLE_22220 [Agriterribacter sp.]